MNGWVCGIGDGDRIGGVACTCVPKLSTSGPLSVPIATVKVNSSSSASVADPHGSEAAASPIATKKSAGAVAIFAGNVRVTSAGRM